MLNSRFGICFSNYSLWRYQSYINSKMREQSFSGELTFSSDASVFPLISSDFWSKNLFSPLTYIRLAFVPLLSHVFLIEIDATASPREMMDGLPSPKQRFVKQSLQIIFPVWRETGVSETFSLERAKTFNLSDIF